MSLNLEQAQSGTFTLTKVGLAIGSTTSQLSTAASATIVIDGVFRTAKGATATFALAAPTGFSFTTIPAGSKAAFGVWVDAAGTLTVTQGPITPYGSATEAAAPPPNPGSRALLGVAVVNTLTNAFVPGTTAFNAAGVTTNYYDTFSYPATGLA